MLLGLEFESPERTVTFVRRMWEARTILNWTLNRDTVVRLAPPLVLTDDEAERAVATIARALA
jgi:acetylornithine/succinyldiaminopimelate/putrescine aminotransferase